MAFGNSSPSGGANFGPNTKVYFAKLKTKDLPAPVWEIKKKEGETLTIVADAAKFVSGNLVGIANKEAKFEKKTIKSVTATFYDPKEDMAIYVSIPHTYLGRNILNSLLSLTSFGNVGIEVYQSKPKPDPKNPGQMRPSYASSAVKQNGNLVYGKFKNEELPKIPKVKVGDQLFSDDTEITQFFIKQVEELAKQVKAASPAGVSAAGTGVGPVSAVAPAKPAPTNADGENLDEDVPF